MEPLVPRSGAAAARSSLQARKARTPGLPGSGWDRYGLYGIQTDYTMVILSSSTYILLYCIELYHTVLYYITIILLYYTILYCITYTYCILVDIPVTTPLSSTSKLNCFIKD